MFLHELDLEDLSSGLFSGSLEDTPSELRIHVSMKRFFAWAMACCFLLGSLSATARPGVRSLIKQLEDGPDFRVRLQAALRLGKTRRSTSQVRNALIEALSDHHAAVRAAAAAALKVLGDARAIPALIEHRKDSSPSVRSQVKASIKALREKKKDGAKGVPPRVMVRLGKIRITSGKRVNLLRRAVERVSKRQFGDLPGVKVMASKRRRSASHADLPVVLVTGRLSRLKQSRQGRSVVYSARIEYVMHQMPGQNIVGKISGSASAHGSAAEMGSREKMEELQQAALEAAIHSALRNAPQALAAATR